MKTEHYIYFISAGTSIDRFVKRILCTITAGLCGSMLTAGVSSCCGYVVFYGLCGCLVFTSVVDAALMITEHYIYFIIAGISIVRFVEIILFTIIVVLRGSMLAAVVGSCCGDVIFCHP